MMTLPSKIESLLFFKNTPVSIKNLAKDLNTSESDIKKAIKELKNNLANRGINIVQNDDSIMLATSPEMAPEIERLTKEELEKDLGKAGLETLTIVLYQAPVTRARVDYIRGVNSTYILRNLLIRGLIEKKQNPNDTRSYIYVPSLKLLALLGLSKKEDLPEYATVTDELRAFEEKKGIEENAT